MKKIDKKYVERLLADIGADALSSNLVLNDVDLYNSCLEKFGANGTGQGSAVVSATGYKILKKLDFIRKAQKSGVVHPESPFSEFMKGLKDG